MFSSDVLTGKLVALNREACSGDECVVGDEVDVSSLFDKAVEVSGNLNAVSLTADCDWSVDDDDDDGKGDEVCE